jgi:cytoskeleton protein RodZ
MMDTQQDNQISSTAGAAEQPASVGKALREAREQLGLSVNDVANRIKFAARQIEALEADDYAQLPEAAFVRGFVRSYARLLELDPAHLVSGLPSSHTKTSAVQEVRSVEIPLPSAFSARRHNIILLSAGLVIALSVAIFMRMHDRAPEVAEPVAKTTVQPLDLQGVATESAIVQLPEQSLLPVSAIPQTDSAAPALALPQSVNSAAVSAPQQTVRAAAVQTAPQPVPQQAVRTVPAPVPVAQTAAQPKAVSAAAAPATVQPKVKAEANPSEHALRLEFDENAWVEVRDGNDNVLIGKMQRAGSLVRVTGKAPLLVTIGNAHAVRLFDNGKNIKLERYTTADVAHVKLN